jgi:phytoene desaturase (3,4-didehydrolycopene-forming)
MWSGDDEHRQNVDIEASEAQESPSSKDEQQHQEDADIKTLEAQENTPLGPATGEPITLQVGGRRYTTFRSTLTDGSNYFARLFSAEWQRPQADGSYLIDADEELFLHILRYLRSGALPIFYNNSTGHDYGMYLALLGEAQFFQIDRLRDWLRNKEYEKAVKIEYSAEECEGFQQLAKTCYSHLQVEYHPTWITKKVYICPRGIFVHRGRPSACGMACKKAQGDAEKEFEEEHELRTMVISKKTILDCGLCLSGEPSSLKPWKGDEGTLLDFEMS